MKVANQLMAFFKDDSTTAPWFLADGITPPTDTPTPPTPEPSATPAVAPAVTPTVTPTVTQLPDLPYDFYLSIEVLGLETGLDELSSGGVGSCSRSYLKDYHP